MVGYASERNIYTATSSNGHYFNDINCQQTVESGLNRLIISIDGTNQESYSKYRIGGDLKKVVEGTKNMVQWKKKLKSRTPFIIWQFVVFRHNEHEVEDIALGQAQVQSHITCLSAVPTVAAAVQADNSPKPS